MKYTKRAFPGGPYCDPTFFSSGKLMVLKRLAAVV